MVAASHGRFVVQKYGGTSVGSIDKIQEIANRISIQYKQGLERPVLVLSAMAGETNRLLSLISQVNENVSSIHKDMALSAGEQVSVALMAAAIEHHGIPVKPLLAYQLGILTDGFHSRARIQSINTSVIEKCWQDGVVPVIAGFQGVTDTGEITTLGRGGSDTTAVALAVALRAKACEINTDVDGFFSADPRIVDNAYFIDRLDFEVALEMASLGSKVLHPRCVELAAKYKMPLYVRNTFANESHRRSCILAYSEQESLEAPLVSGVTLDHDVVRLTIDQLPPRHDTFAGIFEGIANCGVNVDVIVHNRPLPSEKQSLQLGFTISQYDINKVVDFLNKFSQSQGLDIVVSQETDLSKVSIVGLGMRSHPGVAGQCFAILASSGIELHMVSTSEIKISCIINREDAEHAARALHAAFLE